MESFESIIRNYYPLSDESMALLLPHVHIISYPENVCFIKHGSINKKLYFIAEGMVKGSFILNNKEYIISLGAEKDFFSAGLNYTEDIPSLIDITTVKKSSFYIIDKYTFCYLIYTNVEIAYLAISFVNYDRLNTIKGLINHKCYPPSQRYKFYMNSFPEIFNNFSVNEMATFLGITNSSLSRIRKRLIDEERAKRKQK